MAYDHDGRKLAVKVQHPGLHDTAAVDILTVELLVKAVRWCFPVSKDFLLDIWRTSQAVWTISYLRINVL